MKIVDKVCEAGAPNKVNEDSWGAYGNMVWVADGATCLGGNTVAEEGSTDAAWMSATLTDFLNTYNVSDQGFDWRQIYQEMSDYVQKRYKEEGGVKPKFVAEEPLSAIKTLYNHGNGRVTCSGLADCVVLIETDDGIKGMYGDDVHADLDNRSTAAMAPYLKQGMGFIDARAKVADVFKEARAKANAPDGFGDFSVTPAFFDHLQYAEFHVAKGGYALIMSDGLYRLVEMFDRYTDATLLRAAKERGVQDLYQELRDIEDKDPLGVEYARFKKGDDATGVLVQF